jgi:hypothetical protein
MNASALTPSQYIKAADFGATLPVTPTLTIREAVINVVPSMKPGAREGDTEKKGVLYFTDEPDGRGWVMNKTNVECLKAMFGDETDNWIGKAVTLKSVPVQVGPKKDIGVRIAGSPNLTAEIRCVVKLPKRKPETFVLVPTGNGSARKSARIVFYETVNEANMNPAAVAKVIDPIVAEFSISDGDPASWENLWKDLQPGGALRGAYDAAVGS